MLGFNEADIVQFFLSLMRVVCLFLFLPIFGDSTVPPTIRVFLAFTINLAIYPIAAASGSAYLSSGVLSDMTLVAAVIKEAAVGTVLGFTAKIFFDGLSFACEHIGTQMGFNMATMYDLQLEANIPVVSRMILILAMLLFLGFDGHHIFIKALAQSYTVVPVGDFILTKAVAAHILETSSQVFLIAVKLSAPMALVIFLINCAFGIISKAVPQINVLIVSFTVNILAGFFVLSLTLPVFGASIGSVFQSMVERMMNLMSILA